MTVPSPPHTLSLDELEAFISAIEQLSYADVSRTDFFSELARGICRRLAITSLRIVLFHAEGETLLAATQITSFDPLPAPVRSDLKPGETRSDRQTGPSGRIRLILDHCYLANEILRIEAALDGPILLDPVALHDLLGTSAVLAGNFLIRSAGRELHSQLADRQRVSRMIEQLAEAEACSHAESELCRVLQSTLEVDRVMLLWAMPDHARLLGASTSEEFDRNSQTARLLEQITAGLTRPGDRQDLTIGQGSPPPPSLLQPDLDAYLEETDARSLIWIPVHRDAVTQSLPIGFLLLEHFSGDWPTQQQKRLRDLVQPHAVQAARRLLLHVNQSSLSQLRILLSDRRNRYGAWLAGLGLAIFLLLVIRKDLELQVDGTLKPSRQVSVFSPVQGIIDQISVHHDSDVAAGETLFTLRASDREIEERQISGEMATLRSRLESLKAARIRNRSSGSKSASESELSADESDLEAQLKGLASQLALIREQMQQLVVKAPIAGRVSRWDLTQSLSNRPVTHGQFLCDVLDVKGDWEIELEIPDNLAGYVLQAQSQAPCPVTYLFQTDAGHLSLSRISQISSTVQLNQHGKPVVMARMPAEIKTHQDLRVGAGVLARIHCGKRSIGFIYLRELIEFFQKTFWL